MTEMFWVMLMSILIAQFASGAGKKAGEFYTPQQVSKILQRLSLQKN